MKTTEASLATAAFEISARAAAAWARHHGRRIEDVDGFSNLLRSRLKAGIHEALDDAREAVNCGRFDLAELTFRASCVLIGIEAAKINFGVASAA